MKCLYCGDAELVLGTETVSDRGCWSCPECHAEFWPEPIAEITRLRAIVEPLEALLAMYHHVVIRQPNGARRQYLVETFGDDGVELYGWGDNVPDALAAASAERSETDGN
jgi:hypothetical protein